MLKIYTDIDWACLEQKGATSFDGQVNYQHTEGSIQDTLKIKVKKNYTAA